MIGSLRGIVLDGGVVETSAGVGYEVVTPVPLVVGEEVFLHVCTTMRDSDISLWGFVSAGEKAMFKALQEVSGVGPSIAMRILSVLSPEEVAGAVGAGDASVFKGVSGVGPKAANRILLDLKVPAGIGASGSVASGAAKEAERVLQGLGYPASVVSEALKVALAGAPGGSAGELVQAATLHIASGV